MPFSIGFVNWTAPFNEAFLVCGNWEENNVNNNYNGMVRFYIQAGFHAFNLQREWQAG